MTVKLVEQAALVTACERAGPDPGPLLVYADWLEQELQDDEAMRIAYALRWMVARNHRPTHLPSVPHPLYTWYWAARHWKPDSADVPLYNALMWHTEHILPPELFPAGCLPTYQRFSSWQAAVRWLGSRLQYLRDIVTLTPSQIAPGVPPCPAEHRSTQ